jgi:ribosomal protein L18E
MDRVVEQLEKVNVKLDTIISAMKYPKSVLEKVLEYGGAGVSILGILSIIDLIRTWVFGG